MNKHVSESRNVNHSLLWRKKNICMELFYEYIALTRLSENRITLDLTINHPEITLLPSLWTIFRVNYKLPINMIMALDLKAYSQVADAFYDFQVIIPKPCSFSPLNCKVACWDFSKGQTHGKHTSFSARKKSTTSWNVEIVPSSLQRYSHTLEQWDKIMKIKTDS